jgi:prepilin-type N-terminal cleavage/methylation domain-containing protein
MKQQSTNSRRTLAGFTLIELLIVIAIISILAALIIPITRAVNRNKVRARARAELKLLEMAIENYKSKLGHYPPDNPGRPSTNQLYFELLGTTNVGTGFTTLDGSAQLRNSEFATVFGPNVSGFVNCSGTSAGDEGHTAVRLLTDVPPAAVGQWPTMPNTRFLICSVPWPETGGYYPLGVPNLNPFRYNSSNPTNNPNTYDLWVDVIIDGKTNRINNWSKEPIIVNQPW